jgi:hypothetical protein
MRIRLAFYVSVGVFLAAMLAGARPGVAKPEYTRKTKKDCSFCHPPGGYTLTDAGKYYRDHHYTLDGYNPKPS